MSSSARSTLLSLLTLGLTLAAACGTPGPIVPTAAAPRESGQSRLMDTTFAGQNRCNAKTHERPFVVEWDATDMSSFQARTSTDVVFVKYEGCNLTIIDSCSDDSVRGALGSYKPVDWTGGAVEKVDIANATDLYAKLPLGAALLGGRVEAGEKFHMEYFVSGTRSATRPVIYASDLAKIPGCAGVTHFVYGINLGAFVLASESSAKGDVSASVAGMGAGGGTSRSSAIEKKAGELAACRGDSAKEIDACKTPIRLTLREITPGENPDATAARAPDPPAAALNLVGKLEARTTKEREAGEHMMASQTKMAAGDGKGCLAELDAHDRLDPRPAALSTNPKGAGQMRVACLMLAGQCAAGKEMARKSWQATQSQLKSEEIDRMIDMSVASYCRGGSMTDRDRFLVALATLQSRADKKTPADCTKAYDVVSKLADSITPRDNFDMTYDARSKLASYGPACFAQTGDCATAWKVAKEQDQAIAKQRSWTSDPRSQRSRMMSATNDLCIDKPQGNLSDVETVYRSIAELTSTRSASPPTSSYCIARVEKGAAALKRASVSDVAGDLKFEPEHLADATAECLSAAGDCEAGWRRFTEVSRAFPRNTESPDLDMRRRFRDKARACKWKPQGTMSGREKVLWAAGVLEDATRDRVEPKQCLAALDAAKRAAADDHGDKKVNSEWHYGTRDIARNVGRCLQKSGDCDAAFKAYKDARATFDDARSTLSTDPVKARQSFESDVSGCKAK